jgi:aminoglycoside phosphotransferase (APT) family kinase protein
MGTQVVIDEALAAAVIRDQFPTLSCTVVRWLGEGCDSVAFRVDGDWVFRFPKRRDVDVQLQTEYRLLPTLAGILPLPVPEIRYRGSPTPVFPFHFVGYAFIPGVPAQRMDPGTVPSAEFATLGHFLSRLHAIPRSLGESLALPTWPSEVVLQECREEALNDFTHVAAVASADPLDEWLEFLRDRTPAPCRAANLSITHADFAAEHILYDEARGAVTGIIDWSEAALGDPALDLAGFIHWGGNPILEAALAGYGKAAGAEHLDRARYLAACRGVGDVVFGLEQDRPEYVEGGLRALRHSIY